MKRKVLRGVSLLIAMLMLCGTVMAALAEDKKETVYVIADPKGSPTSVTVSERLYNTGKLDVLEDVSTLEDIENVGGDQTWTEENGVLLWNAGGEDIRYEGTSGEPLPVSVQFSYKLDGKPIEPAELAGKSGHLEIDVEYKTLRSEDVKINGATENMPVPFVMITVMRVDEEVFDNIEVDHGKVVDAGTFRAVVCYGLPGVYDGLHLGEYDDIDITIPTTATIEADVKDFMNYGSYTIATSYVLDDIKDSDLDLDLGDIADELEDAIDQIIDGASELYDGSGDLADGAAALRDGAGDLNDGAKQLADGTSDLYDGAKQLNDGASDLATGAGTLADGTAELAEGAAQLNQGASELLDGADQLNGGASDLMDGAEQLSDGSADLVSGAKQLDEGAETLSDGLAEIDSNSDALVDGAKQIFEAVLETANDKLEDKKEDFDKLKINLHTLTLDNYDFEVTRLMREMLDKVDDYVYEEADRELSSKVRAAVRKEVVRQVKEVAYQQVVDGVNEAAVQEVRSKVQEGAQALVDEKVAEGAREQVAAKVVEAVLAEVGPKVETAVADTVRQRVTEAAREKVRAGVLAAVEPQVRAKVEAAAREKVEAAIRNPSEADIEAEIEKRMASDEVKAMMEDELQRQLHSEETKAMIESQLLDSLRSQVAAAYEAEIRSQVTAAVRSEIRARVTEEVEDQVRAAIGRQLRMLAAAGPVPSPSVTPPGGVHRT